MSEPNLSAFIWSVADLLRGDYKQSEYGKVILTFTVLRRLDCVLEATKPAVLAELKLREKVQSELTNATIEALDAHTLMSTQALKSEAVRYGIKDILLNHARLWEALRATVGAGGPEVR